MLRSQSAWRRYLLPTVAIIFGLGVRAFGLDSSLWLDEFSTLWCVEAGWGAIADRVAGFQGQTALYYYTVRASLDLFGESEVALRVPSLMASAGTAMLCAIAAGAIGGRRAALWGGVFSWLAFAQVQTGVNARPYALAIFGVALATTGFLGVCQTGRHAWRVAFVAGACLAFWAHFVLALPVVGLVIGYAATPALRSKYKVGWFLTDATVMAVAVVPAWPYVAAAMARPQHFGWLAAARHSDILAMLAPFALPWALAATSFRQQARAPAESALLASAVAVPVGLEVAWLAGSNLVTARYLGPIVVPAAILAAVNMPRLVRAEQTIAALSFFILTCVSYGRTVATTGTFSGLGVEDWRSTTAEARKVVNSDDLILFRSGFVEEDRVPLGRPHPATLSPLRSPGTPALSASVASLTHSWSVSGRQEYFDLALGARIQQAPRVLILVQRATDTDGIYTDNLVLWCKTVYGDGATVEALPSGRGIDLRLVRPAHATR